MKQIDKQIRGYTGVFFTAGMLSLRGFAVTLTWGNYPSIDLFALNPASSKHVAIQVKTHYKREAWYPLSAGDSDFFVFVDIISNENVEYRIVPTSHVKTMSERNFQKWRKKHPSSKERNRWIEEKDIVKFKDRWDLIDDFLK